ncbi:Hsp33 family molecular chaperone HslO [Chakrabartyella piscis]|uniref:Hsp33 family molecular chaperone HslO n=1 Tax=Chakrabartyella piscis TaxID=2918914 RepID=UPI0029587FAD|nr:Hsp33 family molecular chaperone HslO [Chakrabartyella piscis]
MKDYIVKATAGNGSIRVIAATTKEMVEHARQIHNTTPVASAALGRMLTASAMMGSMLKGEKDLLTLQIRGEGPLGGIVATADSNCNVKGYVFNPNVDIPSKYPGTLDVAGAIGTGFLSVTKDIGMREPYSGRIELVTSEIAEDLTYYFAQSEQTPSAVGLGVLVETDRTIRQAGGFLVQVMPGATDEMIDTLEQRINGLPYMSDLLDMGRTPEDVLDMLFSDLDLNILETVPCAYQCNCSKERVEKALISIGTEELEKILVEDKKADMHCHFCNKDYSFTEEELKALLEEASS